MQAAKHFPRHARAFQAARGWPVSHRLRCTHTAAAGGAVAKEGDHVAVHYTGTLDDGSVFDTSKGRGALEFKIGGGQMIKGFDRAVTGMAVGDTRKVRLEPEEAYGAYDPAAVLSVPAAQAPKGLAEGTKVTLRGSIPATVSKVTDEEVTLDLNHELAGKPLTFEMTLERLTQGDALQTVVFGAGCFWGPELAFQRVVGVVDTQVGYCQGAKEDPTYEEVCSGNTGHVEVVKVTFDPQVLSFEELLDVFWGRHDPTALNRQGNDVGTQYRAGIYTCTPEQLEAAGRYLETKRATSKVPIVTELEPLKMYYAAEEYHQKYLSKGGRFGKGQDPSKGCADPIRCYG